MPDHLHAVIRGRSPEADLIRFMRIFRRRATAASGRAFERLWQDGYHERVLWDVEDVSAAIAYVVQNPIRAGLAKTVDDFPFSWVTTRD